MLNMQEVLKQVAEAEQQSQEEVQLTELVPMKRSRIKNVVKDVDATDGLKALRSISSDCNDKNDNFDMSGFDISKDAEQQFKSQSGKHRRAQKNRKRRSGSKNDIEDADSDDEEKSGDEVAGKKTKESPINGKRPRMKNKTMLARKKPAKSSKETDDKKKHNDSSKEDPLQMKVPFDDDEFAPEENDEEMYCTLDKKDCYKDEVYVYRQETINICPNSVNKESEPEFQKLARNTDPVADCQEDNFVDDVTAKDSVKENCEFNGITEEMKTSEDELKLENTTNVKENCLPELVNDLDSSRELMTSEEICAAAAKPSKRKRNDSSSKSERKSSDRSPKRDMSCVQYWQKKYVCVVCFARFKGRSGLCNHYKVFHGSGPLFKCNECNKEFPLKERLKLHLRIHTGFKPYKCQECDKSFARSGQLVQHRRTHNQDKPFRCNLCTCSFSCVANLTLHVKRHNGQKDHKCELCGRAFVRRDALKKHLECLHRDVKSFVCLICNKTFKGHLPQHMRTHAHERPHGCATCGQRFAQRSQLTVHQRTHTGQRPFRCVVCWQAFAHSTALKLHTRRHTGERPFKCNECTAGFTQLPHWKKHMKSIHGRNDPYGCKWCSNFFRIKSELENHKRICHPGVDEDVSDFGGDGDDDGEADGDSVGIDIDPGINESHSSASSSTEQQQQIVEKQSVTAKYKLMTVEKMRLLLAVLLQRISKKEKLDELGFGKRLIDDVLQDSLVSAGKEPVKSEESGLSELEALTRNLEILLEWTMSKEHWETFRKMNKTPEDILETLTDAEYDLE